MFTRTQVTFIPLAAAAVIGLAATVLLWWQPAVAA